MRTPASALPGLAPRSIRLAATMVDAFLALSLFVVTIYGAFACFGVSALGFGARREWFEQAGSVLTGVLGWVVFIGGVVAMLCLLLYQWYLLSTRGQTIGKSMMGIRIVSLDGKPAGFVQALLLRDWVFYGVMSIAVGVSSVIIPFAGALLALLNYVPLMGEDRRCLHDYLAGTQVRWVRIVEVHVGRLVGAVAALALVGAGAFVVAKRETVVPIVRGYLQPPAPVVSAPQPTPVTAQPAPAIASIEESRPTPAPQPLPQEKPKPPAAPPPVPEERRLYQFTDSEGVVHVTDDLGTVPERYRSKVTTP